MDDTTKNMALTLAAGIIKKGLVTLSAGAVTHGIINSNQTETFVSAGMLVVGLAWSFWNDYGRAIVLAQLEVLKAKSLAQAAKMKDAGVSQVTVSQIAAQSQTLTLASVTKTVATLPPSVQATVAKVLIAAFVMSFLLASGSAMAQSRRGPAFTGDPVADIKTDLSKSGIKVPTVTPGAACDFNIFALLKPDNVVTMIQNCVSDANKLFLPDVQAALDSATKANDKPGMDCLTPGLAIVKAAVGTPGAPAVEAQPANGSTPAIAAVPAVPTQMAGVILIFQKFREFTLANGPSACKNWVQSTINGATTGAL